MKAEIVIPDNFVEAIADRVIDALKAVLCNLTSQTEDEVFDKKGLAQYLKVSESTVDKLVSNKQIPHFKIASGQSGGVRFNKRDIEKWITKRTVPAVNPVPNGLRLVAC